MKEDKSWLDIGGRPMIERGLAALRPLVRRLAIVRREETPHAARYAALAAQWEADLLLDRYPDLGPLAGIATALAAIQTPEPVCILACDLPFVTTEFLARLSAFFSVSEDLLLPEDAEGRAQPLAALYRTRCLPAVETLLHERRLRVDGLYPLVATRRVRFDEYRDLPDARRILLNLNTPDDYRRALEC